MQRNASMVRSHVVCTRTRLRASSMASPVVLAVEMADERVILGTVQSEWIRQC